MKDKKRYPILPIYATAAFAVLWYILLHPQSAGAWLLCVAASTAFFLTMSRAFPPYSTLEPESPDGKVVSEPFVAEAAKGWDDLERISGKYAEHFAGKPIAPSLEALNANIAEINKAIKANPCRAENSYIRRFEQIFAEYCKDLAQYENCCGISNSGATIREILRLIEQRFTKLAEVSRLLVEEAYNDSVLTLRAENEALPRLFAALQSDGDFHLEF